MDRNTVTGLVLILLTMVAWAYFTMPSQEELQQRKAEQARKDSIAAVQADSINALSPQRADSDSTKAQTTPNKPPTLEEDETTGGRGMGIFSKASGSDTTLVSVETPLYHATFTNVGAGPAQIVLQKYKMWDQEPVRMIKDTLNAAYSLGFLSAENYNVETQNLIFKQITPGNTISLQKDEQKQLEYALDLGEGKRLVYTYTFSAKSYEIDLTIHFQGLNQTIVGNSVDFGWQPALRFTEKNLSEESTHASAYAYTGGELEQLILSEPGQNEQTYNGSVDWVSTRTKFFAQVIKADTPADGARLVGEVTGQKDDPSAIHHYEAFLKSEITDSGTVAYKLYTGPLAYNVLKNFDESAYNMVNVGYSWTRWFSDPLVRYVIIPYFGFAGEFMNYGLAIILFGILIKVILYPLTKKSYRSMAAMRELQPEMQEIKEKYKDNAQKQQEATMKLYKKAKVNPLGGCLPNLLQLPILVTLWRFFQNSILIRQQSFLWASDLSAPDYILHLPFSIPILGDKIAGFVLLMSAAMFFQSKLTGGMGAPGGGGAGGGQMAALKYIFPVMMLFIFNNFAAGLSLYYLVYNVVSIGQQMWIYRQMEEQKEGALQTA